MQILGLKGLSTYKAAQAAHMYLDFIITNKLLVEIIVFFFFKRFPSNNKCTTHGE